MWTFWTYQSKIVLCRFLKIFSRCENITHVVHLLLCACVRGCVSMWSFNTVYLLSNNHNNCYSNQQQSLSQCQSRYDCDFKIYDLISLTQNKDKEQSAQPKTKKAWVGVCITKVSYADVLLSQGWVILFFDEYQSTYIRCAKWLPVIRVVLRFTSQVSLWRIAGS